MAAIDPSADNPVSIATVSSTSARLLYYELEDQGAATVADLSDAMDYDPDRVASLLDTLAAQGLVTEADGQYLA